MPDRLRHACSRVACLIELHGALQAGEEAMEQCRHAMRSATLPLDAHEISFELSSAHAAAKVASDGNYMRALRAGRRELAAQMERKTRICDVGAELRTLVNGLRQTASEVRTLVAPAQESRGVASHSVASTAPVTRDIGVSSVASSPPDASVPPLGALVPEHLSVHSDDTDCASASSAVGTTNSVSVVGHSASHPRDETMGDDESAACDASAHTRGLAEVHTLCDSAFVQLIHDLRALCDVEDADLASSPFSDGSRLSTRLEALRISCARLRVALRELLPSSFSFTGQLSATPAAALDTHAHAIAKCEALARACDAAIANVAPIHAAYRAQAALPDLQAAVTAANAELAACELLHTAAQTALIAVSPFACRAAQRPVDNQARVDCLAGVKASASNLDAAKRAADRANSALTAAQTVAALCACTLVSLQAWVAQLRNECSRLPDKPSVAQSAERFHASLRPSHSSATSAFRDDAAGLRRVQQMMSDLVTSVSTVLALSRSLPTDMGVEPAAFDVEWSRLDDALAAFARADGCQSFVFSDRTGVSEARVTGWRAVLQSARATLTQCVSAAKSAAQARDALEAAEAQAAHESDAFNSAQRAYESVPDEELDSSSARALAKAYNDASDASSSAQETLQMRREAAERSSSVCSEFGRALCGQLQGFHASVAALQQDIDAKMTSHSHDFSHLPNTLVSTMSETRLVRCAPGLLSHT